MNILLSIHTRYADAIYSGEKLVEIRKSFPTKLNVGDKVYLYETSPKQLVTGRFTVKEVVHLGSTEFWEQYGNVSGISKDEYDAYVGEGTVVGIVVDTATKFNKPVKLTHKAPMSWRYIK